MRGRKAIPERIKLLRGTQRKSRVNKRQPKPADELPKAPSWLPKGAFEFFGYYTARLEAIGLGSSTHTEALAQLSLAAYQVAQHAATLERDGYQFETKTTTGAFTIKPHPAAAQLSDSQRRVIALTTEFGLTPASQGKVSLPRSDGKDSPYAEFGKP